MLGGGWWVVGGGWVVGRGRQCLLLQFYTCCVVTAVLASQAWNSGGQNCPLEWGDPSPQPSDLRAGVRSAQP